MPKPPEIREETGRMQSGAKLYFMQTGAVPQRVAVHLAIATGAKDDPAGREGTAHVVQHLLLKARHSGPLTWGERLTYLGAAGIDVETDLDDLRIHFVVPSDRVVPALQLLALALQQPVAGIDIATLSVEKEVVRSELRRVGSGHGVWQSRAALLQNLYAPGHPYHRDAPSQASLDAITLESAADWAQHNLLPSRVALAIVGDFERAPVDAVLPTLFRTGLPEPEVQHAKLAKKEGASNKLTTLEVETDERAINVTFELDPATVIDFDPHQLAGTLESHLVRRRALENGVIDLTVNAWVGAEASLLEVRLVLDPGANPSSVMTWFRDALDNAHTYGFGRATWADSKDAFVIDERERLTSLARRVGTRLLFFGDIKTPVDARQLGIRHGIPEEGFDQWITADRMRPVLLKPLVRAGVVRRDASFTGPPPRPHAQATAASAKVNVPADAVKEATVMPSLKGAVHFQLESGLNVVLLPRPWSPDVSVAVAFPGGDSDVSTRGGAEWASHLGVPRVRRGDGAGGWYLDVEDTVSAFHFDTGSAKHTAELADSLSRVVKHLESFDVRRGSDRDPSVWVDIKTRWAARPGVVEERTFVSTLFHDERFAQATSAEEIERTGESEADEWIENIVAPQNAWIVISGNFDPQVVAPIARAELAAWSPRGKPPPPTVIADGPLKTNLIVRYAPGAERIDVRFGCRADGYETADGAEATALLGWTLTERFDQSLLREHAVSYGFETRWHFNRGNATWLELNGSLTAGSGGLALFFEELKQLDESLFEDAAVDAARWRAAIATYAAPRSASDETFYLALSAAYGGTPERLARRGELYATISPSRLDKAWARCRDSRVLRLEGDPAEINAVLGQAGLRLKP